MQMQKNYLYAKRFQSNQNQNFKFEVTCTRWLGKELIKVAQQDYARSRSARQWPQSKVNILVLFAIFLIKATET